MDMIDGKWIKARMSGKRGEQAELARALDITATQVSLMLKGKRQVQPQEVPKLLDFFNEEITSNAIVDKAQSESPHSALVPVYDVAAGAGHGAIIDLEEMVFSMAFPDNYLKKLTKSKPENLAIIGVKGDSMLPTLLDDDVVLLDMEKRNLNYDGLFVLRFDDALHVKRIGRATSEGHVTILSDNRDLYPSFERRIDTIEAVGKVLWYGRKV